MKVSTKGLLAIMAHEAIVTSRYKDSVGVWTIGVGHTKAAGGINPETFTGKITVKEAIDMFREDIVKYENGVNKAVEVSLTQNEFDALVSFHYNTGAIARATLTKSLNAGQKEKAGREMMNWLKPPEIKGRRQSEQDLFLKGKYPAPMVNVYPATSSGAVEWKKGVRVNAEELLNSSVAPVVVDTPAVKPKEEVKTSGFWSFIFSFFKRN